MLKSEPVLFAGLARIAVLAALALVAACATPRASRIEAACADVGLPCFPLAGARGAKLVDGRQVQWSPVWCEVRPLVCAFAVRHEKAHALGVGSERMADCYAVSIAPPDETAAALEWLDDTDPERAAALRACAPNPRAKNVAPPPRYGARIL
jgi:hypothetical protein